MWHRLSYQSGDTIAEPHGIFFMSTADGSVDGWQVEPEGGPPFFPFYIATPGNRMIVGHAGQHDVLLHRESGKSIRWRKIYTAFVGGFDDTFVLQERIAVISSFQDYGQPAERVFILSATDAGFEMETTFTLPDKPDLARANVRPLERGRILVSYVNYPENPVALIVDRSSGHVTELGAERIVWPEVRPQRDGHIISTVYFKNSGTPDMTWGVQTFDSEGRPLASPSLSDLDGPVTVSPDLRYALTTGNLGTFAPHLDAGGDSWPIVTCWSIESQEPLFRVRSATFSGGDFLSGPRWLADSSGFLVYTGGEPGQPGVRTALITPGQGAEPVIEYLPYFPMVASPGDADLFATGHSSVWNRRTGQEFEVGATLGFSDFFSPWNGASDEIVSVVPHGGHGGYEVGMLLAPSIEQPPFGDAMRFAVTGAGTCLNLRSAPGLAASIVTCVPEGTVLDIETPNTPPHPDPDNRQPDEPFEGLATHRNWADGEEFVHVREPAGATGWVATTYLTWAKTDD
jgi:hypothetical protein